MKTVAQLIAFLQTQPQDMPVVVTQGVGEYPTDPELDPANSILGATQFVFFKDDEPEWSAEKGEPGVREVIWL